MKELTIAVSFRRPRYLAPVPSRKLCTPPLPVVCRFEKTEELPEFALGFPITSANKAIARTRMSVSDARHRQLTVSASLGNAIRRV